MNEQQSSTWRDLWDETTEVLGSRTEALWLCEEASGLDAGEFRECLNEAATMRMGISLQKMVGRRLAGEPVQYVLGHWAFRHLDLLVDPRVLIPRPETEQVAGPAIELARMQHRVLAPGEVLRVADMGTGSGAIGLSMAQELPHDNVEVWLGDISDDVCDVARANTPGIGRNARNIRVVQGSWCDALPQRLAHSFHMVVSNPPYISKDDPLVENSVREWEPHAALFASESGLRDLFTIAAQARKFLVEGGWIVLEIGFQQSVDVVAELLRLGYSHVEVHKDLSKLDRMVIGQWPATS